MQLPRHPSQRPLAILAALLAAAPLAVGSRYRYLGCFETPTDLDHDGRSTFQSVGLCARHCRSVPVYGLSNGTECFCGSVAPPWEQLVGEELCNRPCPGYPRDTCKFISFFSLVLAAAWFLLPISVVRLKAVCRGEGRGIFGDVSAADRVGV